MQRIKGNSLPSVQFITHRTERYGWVDSARLALECGIRWIQFRCKEPLPYPILREEALKIKTLCRRYNALFVMNDFVELAAEIEADGVHLGKSDMPILQARQILGQSLIIGGTANTLKDMENILAQGGDYIGLGPFRQTSTKEQLSPLLGLEGFQRRISEAKEKGINLPIFAIGGLRSEDAVTLKTCGAYGLAISSALLTSDQPEKEAEIFLQTFKTA